MHQITRCVLCYSFSHLNLDSSVPLSCLSFDQSRSLEKVLSVTYVL